MPAVVRIKRRIDEEPLSAFILNSKKRRRLDNVDEEGLQAEEGAVAAVDLVTGDGNDKDGEISTILKFAGTIQEQDNSATTQLARLTKEAAKELVLQKSQRTPSNHTERARQEMRQALHESRFRVVNCMRTTLEDIDPTEAAPKEVTIVDIEKQETSGRASTTATSATGQLDLPQNAVQQQREAVNMEEQAEAQVLASNNTQQSTDSDTGYVYDLYLPENELQVEYADMMDDNYLSIRPYDGLVYEDHFNDDDEEGDSEDSNNENYYTNDYPDEDDDNEDYKDSYDHDDIDAMALGIRRMRVGTDHDYIHTFDGDDTSMSEFEESSDDVYYDDADYIYGRSHVRVHGIGDVDGDDDDTDDVDYYDAGGNSDDSDA